ncbi:MAG: ATP-dependent sacrificial sulfur transferase LarE [Candidatus Omnitrophota bacterium]|jgi:uncharacterized protein
MQLKNKLSRLKGIIEESGSCLIAFSGGVDSAFLLKIASSVLPENRILAVTAKSPTYPEQELLAAQATARRFGVRHKIIQTSELSNRKFISNNPDRCYYCKKDLFKKLKTIARENKLRSVFDASNLSDEADFRPGERAKKELQVRSPLQEAGFTKADIRALSKKLGLKTWNKPSQACLASRIPYGTEVSRPILKRVNDLEKILRGAGFSQVRARHHDRLCRLEVPKQEIARLININQSLIDKLKKLGYNYITVDLEGYRTGSLNEVIGK